MAWQAHSRRHETESDDSSSSDAAWDSSDDASNAESCRAPGQPDRLSASSSSGAHSASPKASLLRMLAAARAMCHRLPLRRVSDVGASAAHTPIKPARAAPGLDCAARSLLRLRLQSARSKGTAKAAAAPQQPAAPSLAAAAASVQLLLRVAAQASPALAQQLRAELLGRVKSATTAARAAGRDDFSVAHAVSALLPGLQAAVLRAVGAAGAAPAAAAPEAVVAAEAAGHVLDAVAAVESALQGAELEAKVSRLCLGRLASAPPLGEASEASSFASGCIDMEQLLQAELASALSAQL